MKIESNNSFCISFESKLKLIIGLIITNEKNNKNIRYLFIFDSNKYKYK